MRWPDPDSISEDQLQLSSNPVENRVYAQAKALTRRGHTKSRLGCITCKQRKIKCQETRPSCANCVKYGSICKYPSNYKQIQQDQAVATVVCNSRPSIHNLGTLSVFTANDLRLFHHFLVAAHPFMPEGFDTIWVRNVPTFVHQYDYLMHSILALSGSHLSLFMDDPVCKKALAHRQKAITGLENAFSRWPPKAEEAHIVLAASFLLAYQSAFMPDGFSDHILSLRGCALLSQMIVHNQMEGLFSKTPNLQSTEHTLNLKNLAFLDQAMAQDALHSLARFAHLLPDGRDIERAMFAQLVECVRSLVSPQSNSSPQSSPLDLNIRKLQDTNYRSLLLASATDTHPALPNKLAASFEEELSRNPKLILNVPSDHKVEPSRSFNALLSCLVILSTWPQEDVLQLIDPTNMLGAVVLAHFFALRFIVSPLSVPEPGMNTPMKAMIEWMERIVDCVEDDDHSQWTHYVEWPTSILKSMRRCLVQRTGLTFGDLHNVLMNDPASFREGRTSSLM